MSLCDQWSDWLHAIATTHERDGESRASLLPLIPTLEKGVPLAKLSQFQLPNNDDDDDENDDDNSFVLRCRDVAKWLSTLRARQN